MINSTAWLIFYLVAIINPLGFEVISKNKQDEKSALQIITPSLDHNCPRRVSAYSYTITAIVCGLCICTCMEVDNMRKLVVLQASSRSVCRTISILIVQSDVYTIVCLQQEPARLQTYQLQPQGRSELIAYTQNTILLATSGATIIK